MDTLGTWEKAISLRRLPFSLLFALFLVDAVWLPFSNITLPLSDLFVAMVLVTMGIYAFRSYQSPANQSSQIILLDAVILFGLTLFGFLLSYFLVPIDGASVDSSLVFLDSVLYFDWHGYNRFFLSHELTRSVSLVGYALPPILVLYILYRFNQNGAYDQSNQVLLMLFATAGTCLAISTLLPNAGAACHFLPSSDFYQGYNIFIDATYCEFYYQLRSGQKMEVSLFHPRAIIGFPSFHASLIATICVSRFELNLRSIAIVILALISTTTIPVEGGHHLSDILSGLILGILVCIPIRILVRA